MTYILQLSALFVDLITLDLVARLEFGELFEAHAAIRTFHHAIDVLLHVFEGGEYA